MSKETGVVLFVAICCLWFGWEMTVLHHRDALEKFFKRLLGW
jgi:hypothetical protein